MTSLSEYSRGRNSRIGISYKRSFADTVASVTASTIVLNTVPTEFIDDYYNGGMAVLTSGTNVSKVYDITDSVLSTKTLTVTQNPTGALANDTIVVVPAVFAYVCTDSCDIKPTKEWDEKGCLSEIERKYLAETTYSFGGNLSLELPEQCNALYAGFMATFGGVAHSTGSNGNSLHTFNIGTADHLTVMIQTGSGLSKEIFYGGRVSSCKISQPDKGVPMMSLDCKFAGQIKEAVGTGMTWTSTFWTPSLSSKTMYDFSKAVLKLDAVANLYATSYEFTITKEASEDYALGNRSPMDISNNKFFVDGSFTQYFESITQRDKFMGSAAKFGSGTAQALTALMTGTLAPAGTKIQADIYEFQIKDYSAPPVVDGRIMATITFGAVYNTVAAKTVTIAYDNALVIT